MLCKMISGQLSVSLTHEALHGLCIVTLANIYTLWKDRAPNFAATHVSRFLFSMKILGHGLLNHHRVCKDCKRLQVHAILHLEINQITLCKIWPLLFRDQKTGTTRTVSSEQ